MLPAYRPLPRFLLVGLVMLMTACNLLNTPIEPTAQSDTGASVSPTLADIFTSSGLGDTTTYTDDVIGFSFVYPASWYIRDSIPGQHVILASFPVPTPSKENSEGIPQGQSKIDVIVLPEGTTLESAASDQAKQENVTVAIQESLTLPSGLRAIRLELDTTTGDHIPILLIEVNGRIVLAVDYGRPGRVYDVAGTLRLRA